MPLRRALPTALLLVVLALLGVGALLLGSATLQRFVDYKPPGVVGATSGGDAPRLSGQVVLVVVDGLRYDASLGMPFLNELRHQGAEFIAEAGQPSLSHPAWAALGTGAGPEASGVTTNWYVGPIQVDSMLAEARRAGLKTAIVGDAAWGQLYAGSVDVGRYSYNPAREGPSGDRVIPGPTDSGDSAGIARVDEEFARQALAILKTQSPGLLILHFLGPDEVGHVHGAASPEYRESVAHVDDLLRQVVAGLDLASSTLVVTSDHGQTDRGGHGGWEPEVVRTPLVLVGRGIARPRLPGRAPAQVDQRDVAPTIAVLLGTALPTRNEGRPLFEALALPPEARASRGVDVAVERRALALAYARQLGVEPPVRDTVGVAANALEARHYAQAAGDADDALTELAQWFSAAKEERLARDRQARAPVAALALLAPVAYAVLARPRRETLLALPFGVVYSLASWLVYFGRGYFLSPAAFSSEASVRSFFVGRAIDAGVLALAFAAVVGLAYHRAGPGAAARLGARSLFWAATFLVWQVALFYLFYGVTYESYLPDLQFALVYYLDLVQLVAVGLAAIPAVGLATLAALAGRALARPG